VPKRVKDLSGLISEGRAGKGVPASRGEVLAALLRKRAAAWQGGLEDLEAKLRNQILWSLPVETPDEPAEAEARRNGSKPGRRRAG
jgi:hypothetical protein